MGSEQVPWAVLTPSVDVVSPKLVKGVLKPASSGTLMSSASRVGVQVVFLMLGFRDRTGRGGDSHGADGTFYRPFSSHQRGQHSLR